jgi:polyisoprenoid-binding protein YceI
MSAHESALVVAIAIWVALNGELTLHGVTRPMPVSARVVIQSDSLRASGEFTVRQSEYDIAQVSAAGGAIRVKDELKCTFEIVARRQ